MKNSREKIKLDAQGGHESQQTDIDGFAAYQRKLDEELLRCNREIKICWINLIAAGIMLVYLFFLVRKLQTYGRQFTMTRQAFIDDDIGFLTTIPARYAHSARTTINRQVYQILCDNPVIYDGVALFDTAHSNIADVGTQVTAESLQSMMLKLQLQKDPFGNPVIIRPAYLLVPVGYGFTMYTLLHSPTLHTGDNTQAVNPLYNLGLKVIEDPTLNALGGGGDLPWFLVADRGDAKSIQIDYLNGQEIPTIRRSERPGTLGFVWDIYLDWGITVVDYRGIVKNPGKPLSL